MPSERTLISQLHLHLQRLELIGDVRLGLRAHLLAGPLLDPVEFLVDIHLCGCVKLECKLVVCG